MESTMRREVYENGGFTITAAGASVSEGLAVCADPNTICKFSDDGWSSSVVKWLENQKSRIAVGDVVFGGWYDVANRTIYLELSFVFPEHLKEACLAVAVANQRQAIFNLRTQETISVPTSMSSFIARSTSKNEFSFMKSAELERHRREYMIDGFTLLHNLFSREIIEKWKNWGLEHQNLGQNLDAVSDETWVYQEPNQRHAYVMVNGNTIQAHMPDILEWYRKLTPLLSAITMREVVTAPYTVSGVNLLVYNKPGSGIGWHYDTNLVTFLLYLTDNEEGGTECRMLPSRPNQDKHDFRIIKPRAGTALLMQGRWVLHRGLEMNKEVKVACPWNYYSAVDQWRPEEFDQRIYESASPAE